MIRSKGIFALVVCSVLASGCGTPAATQGESATTTDPNQFSPAEEESLKSAVLETLRQRRWLRVSHGSNYCADVFDFDTPVITDKLLQENTGRVRFTVLITGARPVGRNAIFPARDCLGLDSAPFDAGQRVNLALDFTVERWGSGWQIARRRQ